MSALGFNKKHLDKQIGNELMKYVLDQAPDEVLKDRVFKYRVMVAHQPYDLGHVYYSLYVYCDLFLLHL